MIRPLNIGETREVVLEEGSDNPTVFEIQILDSLIYGKITDIAMVYRFNPEAPKDSITETKMNIAEQDMELVRFGLKSVRNFLDSKGGEIKIKFIKKTLGNSEYDIVGDEFLKMLPNWAIKKLAQEISKLNKVSEETRKN